MSKPDVISNFSTVVATLAVVLQVLVLLVLLLGFVSLFSTSARRRLVEAYRVKEKDRHVAS